MKRWMIAALACAAFAGAPACGDDTTDPAPGTADSITPGGDADVGGGGDDVPQPDAPEPDVVEPEPEPDVVEPEPEPDVVEPEPEPDVVEPEPEPDVVEPEPEPDVVEPEPEPDVVEPEPEPDVVEPEPEPDVVEPEPEPDVVEPEPDVVEPEPDVVDPDAVDPDVVDPDVVDPDVPDVPQPECVVPTDCVGVVTPGPCEEALCDAGTCALGTLAEGTSCDDGDGDACTVGTCDAAGACASVAIPGCIPFETWSDSFDCGATSWDLETPFGTIFWAIDGLPDPPAYNSPACSLNFNDDVDSYASVNGEASAGSATSPVIDATFVSDATPLYLSYWEFHDTGDPPSSQWDQMTVALDAGGFEGTLGTELETGQTDDNAGVWRRVVVDISEFAGTAFQIRFTFDSVDAVANDGAGWFIDDVIVTTDTTLLPPPEVCDNGNDDDEDGAADCDDSDCALQPACFEGNSCDDGVDNDGDGDTDCADSECAAFEACLITGDSCSDPFVVGQVPFSSGVVDTSKYNPFYGYDAGDCPGDEFGAGGGLLSGAPDFVYAFTPTETQNYLIASDQLFDGAIYVVTDCEAIAETCLGADEASGIGVESFSVTLQAGTTYYIITDGWSATDGLNAGEATLVIDVAGESDCADGFDNDANGATDCEDEACVINSVCVPEDCFDGVDNDKDGLVDCADEECVATCDEAVNCADGLDNDGDELVDCEDVEDCATSSDCIAEVCDDTIDNDGDGDTDCDDLECFSALNCVVTGDLCDNAFFIDALPLVATGDTCTFKDQATGVDSCLSGAGTPDAFWVYTPSEDQTIQVQLTADVTVFDAILNVSTECTTPDFGACVASADNIGSGGDTLELNVSAGTTYSIMVDAFSGDPDGCGAFELTVTQLDTEFGSCADGVDNDNDGATDCEEPECVDSPECLESGNCEDGIDNDLNGETDCEDQAGCQLDPACAIPGDLCESEVVLDVFAPVSATTVGAFDDYSTPAFCGDNSEILGEGAPDLVYSFTPTEEDVYDLRVSADFDAHVQIVRFGCDNDETDCFDVLPVPATGETATIGYIIPADFTVWLVVDGVAAGDAGNFTLEVTRGGDVCTDSIGFLNVPFTWESNTAWANADYGVSADACATSDFAGPIGGQSKDYVVSVTVPWDQTITASLTANVTDFDAGLYVVTDCADVDNTCLASSNVPGALGGETLSFPATAGETYFIIVDGPVAFANEEGAFLLDVSGEESLHCADGVDNDNDGLSDCDDSDCADLIQCNCTEDIQCDDGNACTDDVCNAGICESTTTVCQPDGDLCTADVCDPATGCGYEPLANCPATFPYATQFDCDGPGEWQFNVELGEVSWAVDALPDPPAFYSADCSLNFNDDVGGYGSAATASVGTATSLPIDASGETTIWLSYYDWFEIGDSVDSSWDLREIRVSDDGFQTFTTYPNGHTADNEAQWVPRALDLSAHAGTTFQVRFWFDSVDGIANDGGGWFIDDLALSTTPPDTALEVCDDGEDNNSNGLVDCADPTCVGDPLCPEAANCADGVDNDGDGLTDCFDVDCVVEPTCVCAADADCDDGDLCTTNVCNLETTICEVPVPVDCDDGVACTDDACSDFLGGCVNTPDDFACADGDLCTNDVCDLAAGCTNAPLNNCPSAVPYANAFACDDGDWTFSVKSGDITWAVDGLPSPPAFVSADCSLNFNDDIDSYNSLGAASTGWATSTLIDATGVTGDLWLSYVDLWDVEDAGSTIYDQRLIQISTDGFVDDVTELPNGHELADQSIWVGRQQDLSAWAGTSFQIRFIFNSADDIANLGVGWFIDDLIIDSVPTNFGAEVCDDGTDNDIDGLSDCDDTDCAGDPACP